MKRAWFPRAVLAFWVGWMTTLAGELVPDPARIGVFEIHLELRSNGNSAGAFSDSNGSGSWEDAYECVLSTVARYEVVQVGVYARAKTLLGGPSTLTVTGGGSSQYTPKRGAAIHQSWTYLPDPEFNPGRPYVAGGYGSENQRATASSSFSPPLIVQPGGGTEFTGGHSAANEAAAGVRSGFEFAVPAEIEAWTFSTTHSTNVDHSMPGLDATTHGSATCTVRVQFIPDGAPEWEAILEPGPPVPVPGIPSYEDWLPLGVLHEGEAEIGNGLSVAVRLQARNGGGATPPRARFRFVLSDVSREPGVCMNFPPRDARGCDTSPSGPYDLRLYPGDTIRVADDGQSADSLDWGIEGGVGVVCYDFGAYGKLKVIATTEDGQTFVAHRQGKPDQEILTVPLDENANHVADAWERSVAVLDRNLPAEWDGAETPAGQGLNGDGLALYEKYRGFVVQAGLGAESYERLDPRQKYVFVYNPDRVVEQTFASLEGRAEGFSAASECEVRYLGFNRWSGPGAFADWKRVVNYNCSASTHAVDQHALHVVIDPSPDPGNPADLEALFADRGAAPLTPLGEGTEGRAYRDPTAPALALTQWRPAATLRIEIYAVNVAGYARSALEYHTTAVCPGCSRADLQAAAGAYEATHGSESSRKNTIELSATITHEMGHGTGVQHHRPTGDSPLDDGLKNCTMRYYSPREFPADPDDRFELEARGNNPDTFCRRKHNCWSQIKVTDNLRAGLAGAARLGLAPSAEAEARPIIPLFTPLPLPSSSSLALSAELLWDDLIAGDPLRVRVRLHGPTEAVAARWVEGVRLRLVRVPVGGPTEEVVGPAVWSGFVQSLAFDTTRLAITNVTRMRDWLLPSSRGALVAGRYQLEVTWEGSSLAPAASLPAGGVLSLSPLSFAVRATVTDADRAVHERHLAWESYLAGDAAGALARVREAERWDPRAADPLAERTRLIGATSAARMGDAYGAAQFLDVLRSGGGDDNDHFVGVAGAWFHALAPSLRVIRAPSPGESSAARIEVTALPGETYWLQRSADLVSWTTVSTNTPVGPRFEVEDVRPGSPRWQYYRVRWLR